LAFASIASVDGGVEEFGESCRGLLLELGVFRAR
jgi:hypothetical protein